MGESKEFAFSVTPRAFWSQEGGGAIRVKEPCGVKRWIVSDGVGVEDGEKIMRDVCLVCGK